MKHFNLASVAIVCFISGVGVLCAARLRDQEHRVVTTWAKPPKNLKPPLFLEILNASEAAYRRGAYTEAERILDQNISGPYGMSLRPYRAKILLQAGRESEAVGEFAELADWRKSHWMPSPNDLEKPLAIAVKLGRWRDADMIARAILANGKVTYSSFPALNIPDPVLTAKQRIAHAYIVLAWKARGDLEPHNVVSYAEQANRIDPSDVPVMVQLAIAYVDRNESGDREKASSILRKAYQLLPVGSSARRDLRNHAYSTVRIDPAGPKERATLNVDVQRSFEEQVARDRAINKANFERRKSLLQAENRQVAATAPK